MEETLADLSSFTTLPAEVRQYVYEWDVNPSLKMVTKETREDVEKVRLRSIPTLVKKYISIDSLVANGTVSEIEVGFSDLESFEVIDLAQIAITACKRGYLKIANWAIDNGAMSYHFNRVAKSQIENFNDMTDKDKMINIEFLMKLVSLSDDKDDLISDILDYGCKYNKEYIVSTLFPQMFETDDEYTQRQKSRIINRIALLSSYRGHIEILNLAVEGGADNPDEIFKGASYAGMEELVQAMLDNELSYATLNEGINEAARGGHVDIINMISEKVDNVNYNAIGIYASEGGHIPILDNAIEYGANAYSSFFLHAGRGGHLNIIKHIETMFTPTLENYNDVVVQAINKNHTDIVEYAISKGANRWRDITYGAIKHKNEKIISMVLDKADSNDLWKYIVVDSARELNYELFKLAIENVGEDWNWDPVIKVLGESLYKGKILKLLPMEEDLLNGLAILRTVGSKYEGDLFNRLKKYPSREIFTYLWSVGKFDVNCSVSIDTIINNYTGKRTEDMLIWLLAHGVNYNLIMRRINNMVDEDIEDLDTIENQSKLKEFTKRISKPRISALSSALMGDLQKIKSEVRTDRNISMNEVAEYAAETDKMDIIEWAIINGANNIYGIERIRRYSGF